MTFEVELKSRLTFSTQRPWHFTEKAKVKLIPSPQQYNVFEYFNLQILDNARKLSTQLFATLSNGWIFNMEPYLSKSKIPHYDNLTVTLSPRKNKRVSLNRRLHRRHSYSNVRLIITDFQGISALRVQTLNPSLVCAMPSFLVTLHAGESTGFNKCMTSTLQKEGVIYRLSTYKEACVFVPVQSFWREVFARKSTRALQQATGCFFGRETIST